jgi:hypothetical protein
MPQNPSRSGTSNHILLRWSREHFGLVEPYRALPARALPAQNIGGSSLVVAIIRTRRIENAIAQGSRNRDATKVGLARSSNRSARRPEQVACRALRGLRPPCSTDSSGKVEPTNANAQS